MSKHRMMVTVQRDLYETQREEESHSDESTSRSIRAIKIGVEECQIEVIFDLTKIAEELAHRAARNSSGRAVQGRIHAKVLSRKKL